MKLSNRVLTIVCMLGAQICHAWDAQQTGTVNVVNVNPVHKGFMVQLNTSPASNYESQCPGNWAFMSIDDPFFNATLAVLLAAKASGDVVVIYTTGCFQTPIGASFPKIETIEYGVRNGW